MLKFIKVDSPDQVKRIEQKLKEKGIEWNDPDHIDEENYGASHLIFGRINEGTKLFFVSPEDDVKIAEDFANSLFGGFEYINEEDL